jgi:hypothetical protein
VGLRGREETPPLAVVSPECTGGHMSLLVKVAVAALLLPLAGPGCKRTPAASSRGRPSSLEVTAPSRSPIAPPTRPRSTRSPGRSTSGPGAKARRPRGRGGCNSGRGRRRARVRSAVEGARRLGASKPPGDLRFGVPKATLIGRVVPASPRDHDGMAVAPGTTHCAVPPQLGARPSQLVGRN